MGLRRAFDPFPFNLLTMTVSLEAIILSTLLLFSSNRQGARDRVRSDIEYDVNLKAELQIQHLHEKVDTLYTQVLSRLEAIDPNHRPPDRGQADRRSQRLTAAWQRLTLWSRGPCTAR